MLTGVSGLFDAEAVTLAATNVVFFQDARPSKRRQR